jgi:hypothetical protein
MRRALFVTLALLAVAVPAQAQGLEQTIKQMASFWARGDVRALVDHASSSGFSLELGDEPVGPVAARQAAAALKRLFEDRETVAVIPGVTRAVGGEPERAFGEFQWVTRPRGTTIPEHRIVFVAFVLEPEGWRVTQIRVRP